METINQIKAWLNKVAADAKTRKAAHRRRMLDKESREVLQAMEFDGDVYLCYKGVPLLNEDALMATLTESLEQCRSTYMEYINSKEDD